MPIRTLMARTLVLLLLLPALLAGQGGGGYSLEELQRVLPEAERFSDREGTPPVYRGYRADPESGGDLLVGFVFSTGDLPPEQSGYSAPIRVLVGMNTEGVLTGIRVVDYRESLRSSRGDFLSRPGFQGQFTGKSILDPFRVRQDVDGITGATITVMAMSLGIRNAARRVAFAYLSGAGSAGEASPRASAPMAELPLEELVELSWLELMRDSLAVQMTLEPVNQGVPRLVVATTYIRDHDVGVMLFGEDRYEDGIRRAGEVVEGSHIFFIGLTGTQAFGLPARNLWVVQEGDTIRTTGDRLVSLGRISEGKLDAEYQRNALLFVDRRIDITRPLAILVDEGTRGPPAVLPYSPGVPYPEPAPVPLAEGEGPGRGGETEGNGATPSQASTGGGVSPGVGTTLGSFQFSEEDIEALLAFDDMMEEESSALARAIESASWGRVSLLLLLLGMATATFVTKRDSLRWATLGGTLLLLGFLDRGFLSVSHILAGITVGPSIYLSDLSLLILVAFTVLTTLFVGRVFCGYLCPFGAIQDFLDRVVPKRFQRELPRRWHRLALKLKYGVLGLVLAPALFGASFTLYHYFEPFGTVFFWSPSILLWAIAGSILLLSAVVPRFYCRYACPLGAALAIGSLLAPFRIHRVEQCQVCKVCEQSCPTGAIEDEVIDFKECVRCNACEVKLIERAGVCRHDVERIRPLIQLRHSRSVVGTGGMPR